MLNKLFAHYLRIYTLNGEVIFAPVQLVNGQSYVAASRERFKSVEYSFHPDPYKAFSKSYVISIFL